MIVLALGANLPSPAGTPDATLHAALGELSRRGVRIADVSPFYESIAWPDASEPPFVNAVASLVTGLSAGDLLAALHHIEFLYGRKRSAKNAPRTLDLDLIDYEGQVEQGPPALPHPRLQERAFVLVPLGDIAPGWRHPVLDRSVEELIARLPAEARAGLRKIASQ